MSNGTILRKLIYLLIAAASSFLLYKVLIVLQKLWIDSGSGIQIPDWISFGATYLPWFVLVLIVIVILRD